MRPIVAVVASLLLAACGSEPAGPPLVVSDVSVATPMAGMNMTAGYFVLTNRGDEPVRITSVTSPQFGRVEMHETVIDDDVARMRPLDAIVVAGGESVRFERGGKHLMLMEPVHPLRDVTLEFHAGDELVLSVETPASER